MKYLNILSLGAGTQSSTLLLMSCKGILPKLDCAIFADTQCEPDYVYAQLDFLTKVANHHDIKIIKTTAGNLANDEVDELGFYGVPAYIDGGGRLKRQY